MSESHDTFARFLFRVLKPFFYFIPQNLDVDEKRKRTLVVGGALVTIPTLIFFILNDIKYYDTLGIILDTSLALLFLISLIIIRRIENGIYLYRIMMISLSTVILYNTIYGPRGDSSLIWMLIYPPVTFYIFGIVEGLYWCGGMFAIAFITILFPDISNTYKYSMEMRIHFFIAYFILTFLSISFEYLRWHFYTQLEKKRQELENTLEHVRTLDKLVPICSICKKIRDDQGYWNQVEEYLAKHTEAKLSHGICDECYAKHYPDEYAKRKTRTLAALSKNTQDTSNNA